MSEHQGDGLVPRPAVAATVAHDGGSVEHTDAAELTTDDRDFCQTIASEFRALYLHESAGAWVRLALRVSDHVAGRPVAFTWLDVQLVAASTVAVANDPTANQASLRMRALSRLGIIVTRLWLAST